MPRLNEPQTPFYQWPMTPATPANPPSPLLPTPPAQTPAPETPATPASTPTQNETQTYAQHGSSPQAIAFTQRSEPTNNAQRTSATAPAPYADAGVTDDGVAYAGVAAIKGRDANTGIEVEVFSASVQGGMQYEAQAGMARIGVSSDSGANNASMDIMTAQAHMGYYNKDGSTGFNAGATAVAVGVEGTASTGASGVTGGVSIGVGAEYSAGIRDADGDGYGEIGLRGTLELGVGVTIGIQIEDPRGWGIWDYFD